MRNINTNTRTDKNVFNLESKLYLIKLIFIFSIIDSIYNSKI